MNAGWLTTKREHWNEATVLGRLTIGADQPLKKGKGDVCEGMMYSKITNKGK